jgi:DNA mismatch endonuclease Vsr
MTAAHKDHGDAAIGPSFGDVPAGRRRNMRAVRGKDTGAELRVRRLLHALGYRFRLHARQLPGRPDIVFPARRKAIEVRGCFWHRHPDPQCKNAALPATRREWWAKKLDANVARDLRNLEALEAMDWKVLVIWECEMRDTAGLETTLTGFLGPSKAALDRNESRSDQAPLGHTPQHD